MVSTKQSTDGWASDPECEDTTTQRLKSSVVLNTTSSVKVLRLMDHTELLGSVVNSVLSRLLYFTGSVSSPALEGSTETTRIIKAKHVRYLSKGIAVAF